MRIGYGLKVCSLVIDIGAFVVCSYLVTWFWNYPDGTAGLYGVLMSVMSGLYVFSDILDSIIVLLKVKLETKNIQSQTKSD